MRNAKLLVLALLIAACSRTVKVESDPNSGKVDVDVGRAGAAEGWRGTLNPVGGSGITGMATGTSANNMTRVYVNVAGAQAGATLPWHVHEGKCGDASPPIVGPASAYPPLVVGANGRATAQAHLNLDLNEAKSYIVNVHASPTNLGTIVSCGDYND
ncbi:MAG TPA: hypothetical protein VFS20_28445 [Longimicrobium sp.]|nr:hypothetical protein [Longimicrobium sp.]